MRQIRITALIACLLLAQSALITHQLDLSAHADGQTCEYCALAGSFDVPVACQPVVFVPARDTPVVHQQLVLPLPVRTMAFSARAPPFYS